MWRLFVVSFVSLFWEILLIRWIPSELPFLAFFRSLVLLACFLGMSLGCIMIHRVRIHQNLLVVLFLIGILSAAIGVFSGGDNLRARGFGKHSGILEQTMKSTASVPSSATVDFTLEFEGESSGGDIVVIVSFILVTLTFIPVGLLIGQCFDKIAPIPAYLVNIVGAIAGSVGFVVISFAKFSPPWWFLIGLTACWLMVARKILWQLLFFMFGLAIAVSVFILNTDPNVIWSPYQRVSWNLIYGKIRLEDPTIKLKREQILLKGPIYVNHEYHQTMMDYGFSDDTDSLVKVLHAIDKEKGRTIDSPIGFYRRYATPYHFIKPKSVLIIAGGNGNEAAAALRAGVPEIDVVEIDPGIIEVGRRHHPERPYDNPRVRVTCDDARAFLERTEKTYDLIVMNAVDSHSQFASSANLRMDSYIFTLEFFERVREHMAPDGLFAMEFSGFHWRYLQWARKRLSEMLWRVFGFTPPDTPMWGAGGPIFLIKASTKPSSSAYNNDILISTDNWPQYYLREPMVPRSYVKLIVWALVLTAVGLFLANPKCLKQAEPHFMLLGVAFMLLEIKSISELSLVFGNTWFVNSLVIIAILVAIMAANVVVLLFKGVPYAFGYAIVFLALITNYIFHLGLVLDLDFALRATIASFRVAVPIFGAGLVFASSFRRAVSPPVALGWNLLGAMVGGLGEYLSMITGVRTLDFLIMALYAFSLFAIRFSRFSD